VVVCSLCQSEMHHSCATSQNKTDRFIQSDLRRCFTTGVGLPCRDLEVPQNAPASPGFNGLRASKKTKERRGGAKSAFQVRQAELAGWGKQAQQEQDCNTQLAASQARYHFVMLQSSRCWERGVLHPPPRLELGRGLWIGGGSRSRWT
jgi:hypothetical protein